jgi:UDP-3-O-[3-hydroxymyristoyl] N-acetylglucosamine deacetylase
MSAAIAGRGIHRGEPVRVWLHRHEGPLTFRVAGLEIPAALDFVVDTRRCTVLGHRGVQVMMVEHLLAACHVLGYWGGLLIEVEGVELPILDGSAAPWIEPLAQLGPPPAAPAPLVVERAYEWLDGGSGLRFEPGGAEWEVTIDFPHPAIGRQVYRSDPSQFATVLQARTFGFAAELASLQSRGLALGAVAGSGILFGDEEPLMPLRHRDEPVRHKALDALGDFALLGRPLQGRVHIHRGSHRAHIEALGALRASGALAQ